MANYASADIFGDPRSPNWESENLVTIKAPNGQEWRVHKKAANDMQGFLNELSSTGYSPKSSGGFNYRNIRGGTRLSQHAFGNAIDIDAANNPMAYLNSPFVKGKSAPMRTNMPDNVAELAAKYNIEWGGNWKKRPDPMHFEWRGTGAPAGTTINSTAVASASPAGPTVIPDKTVIAASGTPQQPVPEQKSVVGLLGEGSYGDALKAAGNSDAISSGMRSVAGAMGGQPQQQPAMAQIAPINVDDGSDAARATGAQQLMASILASKKRLRGLTLGTA